MEEVGIVKELRGLHAVVTVQRQSACESCPGGALCKSFGSSAEVEALNEAGAHEGDTVKIFFKAATYLKSTIIIYGIPAIMLVVGAVVGKEYLSKFFTRMDPDLLSAIAGFGLFILSFFVMKVLLGREEKKDCIPVIGEILKRAGV